MKKDIVFNILESMLRNSPEASYRRLNPALRSTLDNCIQSNLLFLPNTFERIYNELRGGWWFGDGSGSHTGEGFYDTACACNHASAQKSFEQWAKRPGVLWEENGTAERLHVGSNLTWKGQRLTVTSMRQDSLVACSYKDYQPDIKGLKPGANIGDWLVLSAKKAGKVHTLRVVPQKQTYSREVATRITISYDAIATYRKTCEAALKAMLAKIDQCNPETDGPVLTKEINALSFRHQDLEEIRAAFTKRRVWQEANLTLQEQIEKWRTGKGGEFLDTDRILLRVHDGRVECTNGNSVSVAAARAILPVVLDRRSSVKALNLPLDSYCVERVSKDGVKIGCTLVPWEEVEYVNKALGA